MNPADNRNPKPLIPRLIIGGLVILVLSWLAFMTQYLVKISRQPRGEAPPRVRLSETANPPPDGR